MYLDTHRDDVERVMSPDNQNSRVEYLGTAMSFSVMGSALKARSNELAGTCAEMSQFSKPNGVAHDLQKIEQIVWKVSEYRRERP